MILILLKPSLYVVRVTCMFRKVNICTVNIYTYTYIYIASATWWSRKKTDTSLAAELAWFPPDMSNLMTSVVFPTVSESIMLSLYQLHQCFLSKNKQQSWFLQQKKHTHTPSMKISNIQYLKFVWEAVVVFFFEHLMKIKQKLWCFLMVINFHFRKGYSINPKQLEEPNPIGPSFALRVPKLLPV